MDREQIGSVLAGALGDHNDEDDGCDLCGPSFTCDVKLVLDEVPGLLAAIDDLEVVCAAWRRAASLAANDAADRKAAIDRVLALHPRNTDLWHEGICLCDGETWPCETVRAATDG